MRLIVRAVTQTQPFFLSSAMIGKTCITLKLVTATTRKRWLPIDAIGFIFFPSKFVHVIISTICMERRCRCMIKATRVYSFLMHGHQGWNVRHGLCHIYMIYVYIWVVYSFCLFCCLFIIVTTQFVALYKPCKPKPKPSTYDPPDNHPLTEIQRPILRPKPKQQICHQHANTDHFGKEVNRWYYNETQSSTWATKIPPKIRVEVNCNYYVHLTWQTFNSLLN